MMCQSNFFEKRLRVSESRHSRKKSEKEGFEEEEPFLEIHITFFVRFARASF